MSKQIINNKIMNIGITLSTVLSMIPYIRIVGLMALLMLLVNLWIGEYANKIAKTILPILFILLSIYILNFFSWLANHLN